MSQLNRFVDLDRYPIHRLEHDEGRSLVSKCRQEIAGNSFCALPGFILPEALALLSREAVSLESIARRLDYPVTLYSWMDNSGFPEDHPRSALLQRRCGAITADQFAGDSQCRALYECDEITEFVRSLLGFDTLCRSADPAISLRMNVMGTGDIFDWHFDTNDGAVSLLLQCADQGGVFEYAPLIRSEEDENYTAVSAIVNGLAEPRRAEMPPGTFMLFMGRRSLHRVSAVGATQNLRHSLLFSYDRRPGMTFPEETRRRLTEPSGAPYRGALTPE